MQHLLLCTKVVRAKGRYVTEPAIPMRKVLLSKHLEKFYQGYLERMKCFYEAGAHRIRIIYWLVKKEIASGKLESFQDLINDCENEKLCAFQTHRHYGCQYIIPADSLISIIR